MKLLADEGVDAAIVARLRLGGHDVLSVAELAPGITDNAVLDLANGEERVLLTVDKDFLGRQRGMLPKRTAQGDTRWTRRP